MEKKGLRKKDILRMDGLLPPTRRLPVCDAVSSTSDKKKDKKWSIGGILRRISSIRDYDSSSNDEEIVYKKVPRKSSTKFNRQPDGVVLHSLENNAEQRSRIENNVVRQSADSPHSLHSRSSDGSLDGPAKKSRRNKLKARAEAKRDHLVVDSSSDDDCRRSNGSLNRFHGCPETQNGQQRSNNNGCNNRKTRAARTERYIKRLSRDDGSNDTLNDLPYKRCPTEFIEDKERADNGLCPRPPVHPRRFAGSGSYSTNNSRAFQAAIAPKSSVENSRGMCNHASGWLADPAIYSEFRRYSTGHCVTDLNRNTYGKISRSAGGTGCADNYGAGNFFTYPAKHSWHQSEPYVADCQSIDANNRPPEPPPRDPRYRVFNYSSYAPNSFQQDDRIDTGMSILDRRDFRSSYGSNNEIAWCNVTERENSTPNPKTDFRSSLERINNQYNTSRHGANNAEEIEATTRYRRLENTRNNNNRFNCDGDGNYSAYRTKNKSNKQTISTHNAFAAAPSDWSSSRGSTCGGQRVSRSVTPTTCVENRKPEDDTRRMTPSEEALERRRSSRNLEEALSELEAIYNSLRLGDEDLLDRAERRSMEEFSQKRIKNNEFVPVPDDSTDRTKDDMAYRRMHPKDRPTSLSDIAGQSTLSNISYLIASPVLSRRDSADDLTRLGPSRSATTYPWRRNAEPDVTRDDVLYRSISRANNTLRVIDPQPPFGIPLGPVTAATESDYLHTTPSKPEQPRSSYIPQCEPDVVTDDLAYRTLRKDAGAAARSPIECIRFGVTKEQPKAVNVTRKKRAVRSLSANLYGLIDHDRIHLRREPSLDAIRDEIQEATRTTVSSERPEYLRRVVSDSELSDTDARRRKEPARGRDTDINGNHPVVGAYDRNKPRVCAPLETTEATRRGSPKKAASSVTEPDAVLSSETVLDDEFWHEYLRSNSNILPANSDTAETDFSAYSRLCQDLVNLIKSDEDTAPPIESPADISDDLEHAVDEPATSSLDTSHCSEFQRAARTNVEDADSPSAYNRLCQDLVNLIKSDEDTAPPIESPADISDDLEQTVDEPATSSLDTSHCSEFQRAARTNVEDADSPIPSSSIANSTEPTSESSRPDRNLDFYLRVADENVKLIAEAFGDVADRLRDSHLLSVPKNNSSSASHGSEAETQSARSSTLYSQDEQTNDDEQRLVVSPRREQTFSRIREKRNSTTSNDGDRSGSRHEEEKNVSTAELDLSTAVRNLQLAAASLCEHEPEIDDLRVRRSRTIDVTTGTDEDNSPMRKIGLIADAMRQERERDQEETVVMPSSVETQSDASRSEKNREGERHVCELDRTKSQLECEVRAPYVTNIITVTITTYSMLLLACLLALLVAIVVAS